MENPIIGLIALIVIALVAWAIAELKNKAITFTHSEAEAEGEEEMLEAFEAHGGKEMSLKDILKNNSTKGYKSI